MSMLSNSPLTKYQTSFGIYGTTCEEVKHWVTYFQECALIPTAYLDAAHKESEVFSSLTKASGMFQLQVPGEGISPWTFHWVNGNHFPAQRQIVVHNGDKLESLAKRKEQLTDVALVIAEEGIPEHLEEWGVVGTHTVCLHPNDKAGIAAWVGQVTAPPPLAALILTGGKSERMGTDKALIQYHGQPQWQYLLEQCESMGLPAFLSVKDEAQMELRNFPTSKCIVDQWINMGPIGGILSAAKQHPQYSWMVMACDMPHWGMASMEYLLAHRNPKKMATAFWNNAKQWAEPLATIWERDASPWLSMWLMQSQCARKALGRLPIQEILPPEENWLSNINLPQEREDWIKRQGE
jgi:molybdopterin-guanine dinucleotide biosynthesis protein A